MKVLGDRKLAKNTHFFRKKKKRITEATFYGLGENKLSGRQFSVTKIVNSYRQFKNTKPMVSIRSCWVRLTPSKI